jgi:hypothetical protein
VVVERLNDRLDPVLFVAGAALNLDIAQPR